MRPLFITFTGADDDTDLEGMYQLAHEYPIEWGILFSPKRQGSGRYPSLGFVRRMLSEIGGGTRLSAHLCGGDARAVIERGESPHDVMLARYFWRAQINTADTSVDPAAIAQWGDKVSLMPILQCRGDFPLLKGVGVLFDASGGRGIAPKAWPKAPARMVGYAGGLNPSNVAEAVAAINLVSSEYWIDMETGVRDENDRFSLEKCRAVCEAVYGVKREAVSSGTDVVR